MSEIEDPGSGRSTLGGHQGGLEIAAAGGAGEGMPRTRTRHCYQSREARSLARPHRPEGPARKRTDISSDPEVATA